MEQSSSNIIFEEDAEVQQKNDSEIHEPSSPHSASKLYKAPHQLHLENQDQILRIQPVKVNVIRVHSTNNLKNRRKIRNSRINQQNNENIDKAYHYENIQFEEKKMDEQSPQQQGNKSDDSSKSAQSKSSSNKQTKPAKTIEGQEEDSMPEDSDFQHFDEGNIYQKDQQEDSYKKQELSDFYPVNARRTSPETDHSLFASTSKLKEEALEEYEQEYERQQIKMKNVSYSLKKPSSLNISFNDMKLDQFLHYPIKQNYQIETILSIQNNFFGFPSKYHLHQKLGKKTMLSAKKQLLSLNSKFILSLSSDNHSRRDEDYVGQLFGNFSGSKWKLPEPLIPSKLNEGEYDSETRTVTTVEYTSSVMGSRSVREMKVCIFDPSTKNSRKLDLQNKSRKQNKVLLLCSSKPTLNKGKYQLNFRGVAKMPSNKNFILESSPGERCLIFGKQSQTSYLMHIKYPLNILQAFSICLTSLDSKLFVN